VNPLSDAGDIGTTDLLEYGPGGKCHGAQSMRDDAGQTGILGDLFVEVQRYRVTGGRAVSEGYRQMCR
jgi:hypothetical protein